MNDLSIPFSLFLLMQILKVAPIFLSVICFMLIALYLIRQGLYAIKSKLPPSKKEHIDRVLDYAHHYHLLQDIWQIISLSVLTATAYLIAFVYGEEFFIDASFYLIMMLVHIISVIVFRDCYKKAEKKPIIFSDKRVIHDSQCATLSAKDIEKLN